VGGLVAALLPALPVQADPTAVKAPPTSVAADVPALLTADSIRARLPNGAGSVSYALPSLPDGGVRGLGDWNGDGIETAGVFDDGQWQLWNQVQRPNDPVITTTFGQAGDVPVTGDWNGDGVTDLGGVRGSEWILALGPAPDGGTPTTYRDLTFGDGTGTPVTGDWDGDGDDGIGTYDNGTWVLASSLDDLTTTTTAAYGAPGDLPVVGDWDGDGRDGIGTVRGSTWHLSNDAVDPQTESWPAFAPSAGDVPVGWQVRVASSGVTCPTARAGRAGKAAWVVPSTLVGEDVKKHAGVTGRQVRRSLMTAERYLLGDQYAAKWRATRNSPYLDLISGGQDELDIRLPAMSALTVAVGLSTGAYDRSTIGHGRAKAAAYVDQLVRSIACTHVSLTPGGWGRGWQTAHWAMLAGSAAWLVWDDLSPQTQADVTSMVVDEADRLTRLQVPYWGLPDGTIVTPGDTKAEEDAWNSSLLAFAAAMMPDSPRAALWRAKSAELAVASFSIRPDDTSSTVVNGVSLADRLQGFNAYDNGTVENHQRIHPDYASNINLLWTAADFDRLARQRVPEAMFHNAGLVYSAFSTLHYAAGAPSPAGGTFAAPGGTVYIKGHSWIYYPQGDDWGTARRAHFVSLDAHATTYAKYLRAKGWGADKAMYWHERGQQNLVKSSGTNDGRTYSVNPAVAAQQDTYPGREEYAAQNLATAWLALYIGQVGVPKLDRGLLPVPAATQHATKAPTGPGSRHLAP
jgi:hypothetical protein